MNCLVVWLQLLDYSCWITTESILLHSEASSPLDLVPFTPLSSFILLVVFTHKRDVLTNRIFIEAPFLLKVIYLGGKFFAPLFWELVCSFCLVACHLGLMSTE